MRAPDSLDRLARQKEGVRQRSSPTGRQDAQGLLGQLDACSWSEQNVGLWPAEGNDSHRIALLIGALEQAEHCPLDCFHAPPCRHRPGGIDHKEDERPCPPHTFLAVQVRPVDRQPPLFIETIAGGRTDRRVQGERVGCLVRDGSDILTLGACGRQVAPAADNRCGIVGRRHLDPADRRRRGRWKNLSFSMMLILRAGGGVGFLTPLRGRHLGENIVETLTVEFGALEWPAALAVRQDEFRSSPDVLDPNPRSPFEGGDGAGGLVQHDVGPEAIHLEGTAEAGDKGQQTVLEHHPGQPITARQDALPKAHLLLRPMMAKGAGVRLEGQAPADHLGTHFGFARTGDGDHESKAVEQLRPQVAFFRIHRAHKEEARRMRNGNALALHRVDSHRRGVEQDVDEVVGEKIDLVDVQNAPVRGGEQPRLKGAPPFPQGALEIECPQHAIFRGAQRQVNERDRGLYYGSLRQRRTMRTFGPGGDRIAVERAAGDEPQRRQQGGQGAGRGAFGRAFLAADQHTPDARMNRIEEQCGLQLLLSDQGCKRKVQGATSSLIR
jgi:hypothetical protein